jgi:hypothetical protein
MLNILDSIKILLVLLQELKEGSKYFFYGKIMI